MSFIALMGLEDSHGSSDPAVKRLSEVVEVMVDEASIGQLPHEPTGEVVVLQVQEIAPRPMEEPLVPTESMVFRAEGSVTEPPELDEQLKMAN